MGYQTGRRELGRAGACLYWTLVVGMIVSTLPSVLMVNALSTGALALTAYALGRGRLPIIALFVFLACAFFLQAGKSAIREKYWADAQGAPISFAHFPAFLNDWIGFSSRQIFSGNDDVGSAPGAAGSAPQTLTERSSQLELFLRIQEMSPDEVPYLHGATYFIIRSSWSRASSRRTRPAPISALTSSPSTTISSAPRMSP